MVSATASTSKAVRIVLIEDNDADVFLVEEALSQHGLQAPAHVLRDGAQAQDFVLSLDANGDTPVPDLFLLDLNLPKRSGLEVLALIRQSRRCAATPVVIMTSSDSPLDRQETRRLHADRYFRKPSGYEAFMEMGKVVRDVLGC